MKRTALETEGVKIERRLARALLRSLPKLGASVSIFELMMAIQAKDVKRAMALFPKQKIQDALIPSARIVQDATVKGGKIAAKDIRRIVDARRG